MHREPGEEEEPPAADGHSVQGTGVPQDPAGPGHLRPDAGGEPAVRADGLSPCIAWGSLARRCAELAPGNRVELEGRLQSRVYTKRLGETSEERTAFEVSVSVLERLDAPAPAEQPCG